VPARESRFDLSVMSTTFSPDEEIFAAALERPKEERRRFLVEACNGNAALLARVGALIAAHEGAESLLAHAPIARPAVSAEEKPADMIGRYKLLQKIGEGGCGVVWMAEQEEPVRRRVALKVKAVVPRWRLP
jgi:eukaryotic-like serine/threonine-protein kinase